MTQTEGIAVTYTGRDDPFIDRLYRSGLTFTTDQTRTVPPALAARFLQHTDVFKRAGEAAAAEVVTQTTSTTDDTQQQLDEAQKKQDEQQQLDDARFALLDQLDGMDKSSLIDWAAVKYQQKIHPNTGEAKVREQVKGFIDQYGMP